MYFAHSYRYIISYKCMFLYILSTTCSFSYFDSDVHMLIFCDGGKGEVWMCQQVATSELSSMIGYGRSWLALQGHLADRFHWFDVSRILISLWFHTFVWMFSLRQAPCFLITSQLAQYYLSIVVGSEPLQHITNSSFQELWYWPFPLNMKRVHVRTCRNWSKST